MAFRLTPDRKNSENKTIRFPAELVSQIEEAIIGKEVSFSGFVIQACRYALSRMEDKGNEKEG